MGQGQGLFSIHGESVGDGEPLVAFEQGCDISCTPSGDQDTHGQKGQTGGVTIQEAVEDLDGEGWEGSGDIRREAPVGLATVHAAT